MKYYVIVKQGTEKHPMYIARVARNNDGKIAKDTTNLRDAVLYESYERARALSELIKDTVVYSVTVEPA